MAGKRRPPINYSPAAKARRRTYDVWRQMHNRCSNPASKDFPAYGGRGIRVCEAWGNFQNYVADMGLKPDGFSIDRDDVDGNYEPSNCRWIPMSEQSATRRIAKRVQAAVPKVLELRAAGLSQDAIAKAVGIDQTTVGRALAAKGLRSRVNTGRNWRAA